MRWAAAGFPQRIGDIVQNVLKVLYGRLGDLDFVLCQAIISLPAETAALTLQRRPRPRGSVQP